MSLKMKDLMAKILWEKVLVQVGGQPGQHGHCFQLIREDPLEEAPRGVFASDFPPSSCPVTCFWPKRGSPL